MINIDMQGSGVSPMIARALANAEHYLSFHDTPPILSDAIAMVFRDDEVQVWRAGELVSAMREHAPDDPLARAIERVARVAKGCPSVVVVAKCEDGNYCVARATWRHLNAKGGRA